MYLYLKQKVFTIRDRLTFFDETGSPVYFAKGSLFVIPKRLTLTNAAGVEFMQVRKKLFRLFRTYGLIDLQTGQEIGTIKRRFSFNKNFGITVNNEELTLKGSLFGFHFTVLNPNGEILLTVDKKIISWGDTYQVSIDESKIKPEIAAAICIAFDDAVHGDENSSSSSHHS